MWKWLIGPVAVVVIGAGAVAGQILGLLHLPLLGHVVGTHAHRPPKPPAPVTVAIPTITTNLGGITGSHFAQVSVTVSVSDAQAAKEFDAKLPAIEDAVIADLRQSTAAQLDANGGMTALRDAVTASLVQVLGSRQDIRAVYFTQFIVQ